MPISFGEVQLYLKKLKTQNSVPLHQLLEKLLENL